MNKRKPNNIFIREQASSRLFNFYSGCEDGALDSNQGIWVGGILPEDLTHDEFIITSQNVKGIDIPYFIIKKYTGDIIRIRLDKAEYYRFPGEFPTPYNILNEKELQVLGDKLEINEHAFYSSLVETWNGENEMPFVLPVEYPDYHSIKEPEAPDSNFEKTFSKSTLLASFSPDRKKKIDHLISPEEQTDDILNLYWNARGEIPHFVIQRADKTIIRLRFDVPEYLRLDGEVPNEKNTLSKAEAKALDLLLNSYADEYFENEDVYSILLNCWNALNQQRQFYPAPQICLAIPSYKNIYEKAYTERTGFHRDATREQFRKLRKHFKHKEIQMFSDGGCEIF